MSDSELTPDELQQLIEAYKNSRPLMPGESSWTMNEKGELVKITLKEGSNER